ncbi:uncharacterized protein isoform X2 [Leptinotarsa decemlineata]|uniref:uncharacterized protein isoform X2 n=1 Tax=Leptinotarsa decemlineata TaxID=7539 RepID=UPI003D307A78
MADSKRNSSEPNSSVSHDLSIMDPSPLPRAVKTLLPHALRFPMADSERNSSEPNSSVSHDLSIMDPSPLPEQLKLLSYLLHSDFLWRTLRETLQNKIHQCRITSTRWNHLQLQEEEQLKLYCLVHFYQL